MGERFTLALGIVVLAWCGLIGLATAGPMPTPFRSAPAAAAASQAHYILAISWEPAFCEGAGDKPECRVQSASSYDASHFSLHGLWPDDEYCGVSDRIVSLDKAGRWSDLPPVQLTADTRAALERGMPGTKSLLERHEWLKHGSCADTSADIYFGRALAFLDAINSSAVRDMFAGSLDRTVSGEAVRAAFTRAFGQGAGARVRMACVRDGNRRLISELTIGLDGEVMGSETLAALIAGARPTSGGCDSGIIDRAGGQ